MKLEEAAVAPFWSISGILLCLLSDSSRNQLLKCTTARCCRLQAWRSWLYAELSRLALKVVLGLRTCSFKTAYRFAHASNDGPTECCHRSCCDCGGRGAAKTAACIRALACGPLPTTLLREDRVSACRQSARIVVLEAADNLSMGVQLERKRKERIEQGLTNLRVTGRWAPTRIQTGVYCINLRRSSRR